MIRVELVRSGEVEATADAETPEAALLAGQTLWDDASDARPTQAARKNLHVRFIVPLVDDDLDGELDVFTYEGRPR